ncbi:MAG TPA: nitroreductase family protein [Casimicrobiaceae bacterium]|nr:nitroreductase family protein [Casimicrobiaceae bacterium]
MTRLDPPNPDARAAALAFLLHRHSTGPKHLREPGPTDAEIVRLAQAALRAPDHGKKIPFRFAVVRGPAKAQLGDLFEAYGRRRGKPDEDVAAERDRAERPPVLIAVVARIAPDAEIPACEQWMAVGGAVANAMNALQLMGYAGKMLSGARAADPAIAAAFCEPGETLVGWIAAGTASSPPTPREEDAPAAIVRRWPNEGGA